MRDTRVRLVGVRCACGLEEINDRLARLGEPPNLSPFYMASTLRGVWKCDDCGEQASFETAPLAPYPATDRDEDSEWEYAREDAPLLQEDRR